MAAVIAELEPADAGALAQQDARGAALRASSSELFPNNAVEYFVSYYDYYQPEAYVPRRDTYIEKDASRNENIERLRHSATRSLLERRDVADRGLGLAASTAWARPTTYAEMALPLAKGEAIERDDLLRAPDAACSTRATTSTSAAARSARAAT